MSYKEQAQQLGIKVDGRWSEERIKAEIIKATAKEIRKNMETAIIGSTEINRLGPMNALAKRIFEGQGSIPDIERVQRIAGSLRDKGYTSEEIAQLDLPIENLSKYLG